MQPHPIRTFPFTSLDLAELPESERFGVWKESISVIFEVPLAGREAGKPFTSSLSTCHLGSMLRSHTINHRQFFQRSPKLTAQDNLDHFMVQIYRRGRNAGMCLHTRRCAYLGSQSAAANPHRRLRQPNPGHSKVAAVSLRQIARALTWPGLVEGIPAGTLAQRASSCAVVGHAQRHDG